MPWVGFEPTIPALERAKTIHALDRAATLIGFLASKRNYKTVLYKFFFLLPTSDVFQNFCRAIKFNESLTDDFLDLKIVTKTSFAPSILRFFVYSASCPFPLVVSHICYVNKTRWQYNRRVRLFHNLPLVTPFCFTISYKNQTLLYKVEHITIKYQNISCVDIMKGRSR
jgi:hypothetical protein